MGLGFIRSFVPSANVRRRLLLVALSVDALMAVLLMLAAACLPFFHCFFFYDYTTQ